MTTPIVALTSGGLDSTVMIHTLLSQNYEVYPLFFDYKQRNYLPERDGLLNFMTHLRTLNLPGKLHTAKIIPLPLQFLNTPLQDDTQRLSASSDLNFTQTKNNEFVPCRNILFLTFAAAYASSLNISTLAIGSHKEKLFPFPDSSPKFLNSMEKTLSIGTDKPWLITRPWINTYKSGIISYAKKHNIPYELTYTCYAGTTPPCGTCRACKDRQTAEEESEL